jgi:HSP20 family molecular chaperone IbpA
MSSSFLQRLKKKSVIPDTPEDRKKAEVAGQAKEAPKNDPVADQLHVDIFKVEGAIIVYAQIAGATIHDYAVLIEGDGDTVTIKGQRARPNGEYFSHHPNEEGKEKILEECSWGPFYRQIILPAEVDAAKTEAKMREGVLMLYLPLKTTTQSGVKIEVTEL